MGGNAYLVNGGRAVDDLSGGISPLGKLASIGFDADDGPEARYHKVLSMHVFAAALCVQIIALMGWQELVPIVLHASIVFVIIVATIVALSVTRDNQVVRITTLASGLVFALLHFFAQGCQPVGRSAGHVWVIILPTLLFNVPMGGGLLLPSIGGAIHFLLFIIAAIVESVSPSKSCYKPSLTSYATDAYGLTFVDIILPVSLCVAINLYDTHRTAATRRQKAASDSFSTNVFRHLVKSDYTALAALCTDFDAARVSREETQDMSDEAILVAVEHINTLRELVPAHLRGADYSTPVQHIARTSSIPNINAGSLPPDQRANANNASSGSMRATRDEREGTEMREKGGSTGGSSHRGSFSEGEGDGSKGNEVVTIIGGGVGPESGDGSSNDPFVPARLSPKPAASPNLSPVDGNLDVGRSQRKPRGKAFGESPESSAFGSEGRLRRKSSVRDISMVIPMTYEPSFMVAFTLPYITNYAMRSIKNIELLKLVFTEFADNTRKATSMYHGMILWSSFSSIYCKFPDIHSASCASLALLDLMKQESKHHIDQNLLDMKAHQPFVVILHAHVLSGLVGSDSSSLAQMGCSPADRVVAQILDATANQLLSAPAIVAPAILRSAMEGEFHVSDSPHPMLIQLDGAKNFNEAGFPLCLTTPPFIDIQQTEILDFEIKVKEISEGMLHGKGETPSLPPKGNASSNSYKSLRSGSFGQNSQSSLPGMQAAFAHGKRRRLPPDVLEIWNKFDADRSGFLDVDEVREVLLEMGITMTDPELKTFFDTVDTDKSGTVSQEEFTKSFFSATLGGSNVMSHIRRAAVAMARNTGVDNLPIVLNAWKKYDTDGSGCMDAQEIFHLLQDLNLSTTEEEAEWLVQFMDKNGNGTVEFDEFVALFSEDDTANLKMNAVKERIQTVTRVITNKASGKTYSNAEQETRDKLVHLDGIVKTIFVLPIYLYILYNMGSNTYRSVQGTFLTDSLERIIADIVLDFAVYGTWVFLKLGFLPRESSGQIIWKRAEVLKHSVKTIEFWVDILVLFPGDFIFLGLGGLNAKTDIGVIGYYRLNKLLALYHYDDVFALITRALDPALVRVMNALSYFLIWAHIVACGLILVARNIGEDKFPRVVNSSTLLSDDDVTYLKSYYCGVLTAAGQLVGDPVPPEDAQLFLGVVCTLIGLPMFTVVIGTIGNAINVEDSEERFLAKLDELRSYFAYTNMPQKMEDECVGYYRHVFNTTGSLDITDNPLEELPVELSVPVTIEIGREMLKKVPIFAQACENLEFVHELTSKLVPKVLEPGIIIMKKGDRGSSMYFLTYGECEVLTAPGPTGIAVFTFKKGAFFGEIALLHNVKRTATIGVGKKRYANVLTLDKKEFDEVAQTFPQSFSQVYKSAEERIKQILEKEAEEAKIAKEKRRQEKQEQRRKEREARGDTGPVSEEVDDDDDDDDNKDGNKDGPGGNPGGRGSKFSLQQQLTRPISQQTSRRPVVEHSPSSNPNNTSSSNLAAERKPETPTNQASAPAFPTTQQSESPAARPMTASSGTKPSS